jgi:ubiquinone/menaquinone biosynthesis C-methylase UbiE
MSEKAIFQDKTYLRDQQYRDSSNLDARANLHRLYSTSPHDWQAWVFDQMALQPGMAVLECGCGPGWLWRSNLDRIPPNCQITLSDFSDGMVAEAEAALAQSGHDFRFQTVNIEDIPFADNSFDVVVANHMLYHVPHLAAALAEVRRVLRPNGDFGKLSTGDFGKLSTGNFGKLSTGNFGKLSPGRFYTATNGADHMREIKELALQFAPPAAELAWPHLAFRLENGRSLLAPVFDHVDLLPYEDSLQVTDPAPLIAYMQSMSMVNGLDLNGETAVVLTNQLTAHITQEIEEKGAYHITKSTGLFVAW